MSPDFAHDLQRFSFAVAARWLRAAVEAGWLRIELGDGTELWTDEVEAVLKRLGPDPTRPDPTRPDPTSLRSSGRLMSGV